MADKYFVLQDGGNDTDTVFHSRARGAALKAASADTPTFASASVAPIASTSSRAGVGRAVPAGAPNWVGGKDGKVWKSNVKKIGVDRLVFHVFGQSPFAVMRAGFFLSPACSRPWPQMPRRYPRRVDGGDGRIQDEGDI